MIYIALCDDNKQHLAETVRVIQQNAASHDKPVVLSPFTSAELLLSAIRDQTLFMEIAILDIDMQEMDGVTLAKRINELAPRCQIIFLTGYVSCAMDVYEADHIYCVLKEMLSARIWPAIEKASARYLETERDYFPVCTASGTSLLRCSDICFLERCGRKTRIQTTDGEVWCRPSLQALLPTLPSNQFIRCHQGFIVNLNKVVSVSTYSFTLADGTVIPISRANRKDVQAQFFNYCNASIFAR